MIGADLRLVPAAVTIWLVTVAGLQLPPLPLAVLGAAAAALCLVLLRARLRWAALLAVVAAFASATALLTAFRLAERDGSSLTPLAVRESEVELQLVLDDDPRALPDGPAGTARVLIPATALRNVGSGDPLHDSVLVLADHSGWSGLLPGQHVQVSGRLLPPQGADLVVAALSTSDPPQLIGRPSALQRGAGRLRSGLVLAAQVLPPGPRGLLPGLVVGDTSGLDPVLAEQFRVTGLTHLVAVSGANCAIVVGSVIWLLRRCRVPHVPLAIAAGLALAGFVVLARPSPSVLRAAAMGMVALLAFVAGRPRPAVPALAAAISVLLVVSPSLALSAGFALSVAATMGILLFAPAVTTALKARRVPGGLAEAIAVTVAAGVLTAPLIAALSGSVSVVSLPANVLVAPAVPVATVLGVLATLVSPLSAPAAAGLAWLAGFPTRWLVTVAEHGSMIAGGSVSWPGGLRGAVLLAVALILAAIVGREFPAVRRIVAAATVGVVVIGLPVRTAADANWPPTGWLFVACDVGQGDALALNAGPHRAVVIDTGPDPVLADRCLRQLDVEEVPLLLITHLHLDHIGGLAGAVRGRTVGEIDVGPMPELAEPWADVQSIADSHGIAVRMVGVGQAWTVAGIELTVLAPQCAFSGTRSDPNNSSLVLRARIGSTTMLLTGDIEVEAQQALLQSGADVRADVLKVPHHGSAHQDMTFLAAVGARLGVISVGAGNDYGHPAPLLLAALDVLGMRVTRTDQDGAVAVGAAAGALWVSPRARGSP